MSNYTQLGLIKQTDGENEGTWGDKLNESLIDLLDDAIGGYVEVSVASGNVTLAFADGTADNNGRHAVIKFTGSPGTTRTVTFPNKQKTYYINNGSDGSVICTAGSGGATVTVLAGNKDIIYVDGSDEIHSVLTRTSVVLGTNTSTGAATNGTDSTYDIPIIPERFNYIIIDGAMVYMMRFRSNEQSAQIHQQKFMMGMKAMRRLLLDDKLYVESTMIQRPKFSSHMLSLSS